MNTPSEWANDKAGDIAIRFSKYPDGRVAYGPIHAGELSDAIALALDAARRAPEGHIIDDKGKVRKVLGTLPVTKDNVVVGEGAVVVGPCGHEIKVNVRPHVWCGEGNCWSDGCQNDSGSGESYQISECFSTREAAEKAREQR